MAACIHSRESTFLMFDRNRSNTKVANNRHIWPSSGAKLHRCAFNTSSLSFSSHFPHRTPLCLRLRYLLLLSTSYTKYKISINTKEKQKEKQKKYRKAKKTWNTWQLQRHSTHKCSMAAQTSSLLILLSDSTNSPSRTITNSRIISAHMLL